jgi:hypothetical protein
VSNGSEVVMVASRMMRSHNSQGREGMYRCIGAYFDLPVSTCDLACLQTEKFSDSCEKRKKLDAAHQAPMLTEGDGVS